MFSPHVVSPNRERVSALRSFLAIIAMGATFFSPLIAVFAFIIAFALGSSITQTRTIGDAFLMGGMAIVALVTAGMAWRLARAGR